ncbi:MAG TPA: hypothetical protein VF516_47275 [Kofleriaceae bacterium]
MFKLAAALGVGYVGYLIHREWKSKRHSARTLYGYEVEESIASYLPEPPDGERTPLEPRDVAPPRSIRDRDRVAETRTRCHGHPSGRRGWTRAAAARRATRRSARQESHLGYGAAVSGAP